jgi:transcriptional regulator GlxA family with amidase domain
VQSVTFFLCDQMLATSVTLPLEQLCTAQSLAQAHRLKPLQQPLEIRLASIDGKPKRCHTGLVLQADCAIDEIAQSDLTYLPALFRHPRKALEQNQALLPWLRRQHNLGHLIAGVGTGCCFMAEAGLLNGRVATTHWHYFEAFAQAYPQVSLKRDYFITQSDNLFCTGSVNSTADLTIYFIEQAFSAHVASHVERHFFHEIRKSFPAQGIQTSNPAHPDELIAQAQDWLSEHCCETLVMQYVAEHFGLSLRSFNRRFRAATNQTPLHYLQKRRILLAKDLLKTSNLSIGEIALNVGYQDFAHFTQLFKKHLGTTPSSYRTTVRAKLFSANFDGA